VAVARPDLGIWEPRPPDPVRKAQFPCGPVGVREPVAFCGWGGGYWVMCRFTVLGLGGSGLVVQVAQVVGEGGEVEFGAAGVQAAQEELAEVAAVFEVAVD